MTPQVKRIAIVFRGIGDIGGTNNTIADHARYFRALGHDVDLIGEKVHRGDVTPEMGQAVRIRRVPLLSRYKWRWFAERAQKLIDNRGYTFVAGHGHHYRQHVLSMHNCLHLAHEIVEGRTLNACGTLAEIHDQIFDVDGFTRCICNSRLMQDDLAQRYGVSRERLPVIYPGYRPEQFNRADRARHRYVVRAELGCNDEVLIGLVTSGDYRKRGLDILLEAYAGLENALQQASRVLILGKQGGAAAFIERARSLGIADRFSFVKHTREPQRYFHALDICVHPARIEEFGQSVQEAIVCGIPVVTSQRVGATELLPRRIYESLPATPTPMNIRAQLADLIRSSDARQAYADQVLAQAAVNTADANFQQTLAVYEAAGL